MKRESNDSLKKMSEAQKKAIMEKRRDKKAVNIETRNGKIGGSCSLSILL